MSTHTRYHVQVDPGGMFGAVLDTVAIAWETCCTRGTRERAKEVLARYRRYDREDKIVREYRIIECPRV